MPNSNRLVVAIAVTGMVWFAVLQSMFHAELFFDWYVTFLLFVTGYAQYQMIDYVSPSSSRLANEALLAVVYALVALTLYFATSRVSIMRRHPWKSSMLMWTGVELAAAALAYFL